MGITIHYDTEFRGSKKNLIEKLANIAQFAQKLGFTACGPVYEMDYATSYNEVDKHTPVDENGEIDCNYRWAKIQAEPRAPMIWYEDSPAEIKQKEKEKKKLEKDYSKMNGLVLSLWWGEGCESTNLCFIRKGKGKIWKGCSFTKTEYASNFIKAHISVCSLLKYAQKEGVIQDVRDEAEYYETEDITILTDNKEQSLKCLASLFKTMSEAFGEESIQGNAVIAEEQLKDFSL